MVRKKAHSIIYVPVKDARAPKLPVILLADGSRFYEALHWTIERHRLGLSGGTLKKQNEAIGAFIDFYDILKRHQAVTADQFRLMLSEFRDLRTGGCQELGWKPVSVASSEREIEYLSSFFDHCADAFGYVPVNAEVEVNISKLSYAQQMVEAKKNQIRRKGLLGHLWRYTKAAQGVSSIRPAKSRQRRPRDANSFKSFPPARVAELIESCHSVRDVLAFLLLFYGGLRSSELCHILVADISPFPDEETGAALVTVAHPEFGWVNYHRKSDGKLVKNAQRQVYLQDEYGLTPRNLLAPSDPLHAGWKGMTYESRGYRNQIHWSRPDMGVMFYELHKRYMAVRARTGIRHPYYFINSDPVYSRASYGQPMKLKSLRDRFHDACLRIGLQPDKANGVNPHSARHFYGYFLANILKVSKEMAQRYLRHADIDSTDVYYNLSAAVARDALLKAFEKAAQSVDQPLLQPLQLNLKD